jgi:hypothetical protein
MALPDLLDGLRGRRQLAVRALTPVLLFVVVAGTVLVLGGADPTEPTQRWTVAVEGDVVGAEQTLSDLAGSRVDFVPTDDAALAVIEDADAAIRVPDRLDERLAAGEPATVGVVEVTTDAASRTAVAQLRSAAMTRERSLALARGGLADDETVFAVELTQVELTQKGTRVLGAESVAAVVCLQAAMLVSGAAHRFSARRTSGLLVAQLTLPVERRQLALSKGMAELVVGGVAALPVAVPVLALAVVTAVGEGGAGAAAVAVPAVVAAFVVLGACATSLGVAIGAAARTPEQLTLGSSAAVVAASVVAATVGMGDFPRPPAVALLPVVGPVSELRAALGGGVRPVAAVVAVVTTGVATAVCAAVAGRVLDAERLVARSS